MDVSDLVWTKELQDWFVVQPYHHMVNWRTELEELREYYSVNRRANNKRPAEFLIKSWIGSAITMAVGRRGRVDPPAPIRHRHRLTMAFVESRRITMPAKDNTPKTPTPEKLKDLISALESGKPDAVGKLIGIVDQATYDKMRSDHEQQTNGLIAAASQADPAFVLQVLKIVHEMNPQTLAFDGVIGASLYAIVQRAMDLEKILVEVAPERLVERLFVYE